MPKIKSISAGNAITLSSKTASTAVTAKQVSDWTKANPLAKEAELAEELTKRLSGLAEVAVYVHVGKASPLAVSVMVADVGAKIAATWWEHE